MSTRALCVIKGADEEIAVIYRHYDGNPAWFGKELAKFLDGFQVVNGLANQTGKIANGMECLAAQIVTALKTSAGNVYLYSAGTRNIGEEYTYIVEQAKDSSILLAVSSYDERIFKGSPEEFLMSKDINQ